MSGNIPRVAAIGVVTAYLIRRRMSALGALLAREAVGLAEFLALGFIALSSGIALLVHANGFLAVFAAGLSVTWIERERGRNDPYLRMDDRVG